MIEIELTNNVSTIRAPAEILTQLRHIVSVREQLLPPREVQKHLKRWAARSKRMGFTMDLDRVYASSEGAAMASLGWEAAMWTKAMFEAVLRNPGIWDGWKSLISSDGRFGSGLLSTLLRSIHTHLRIPPTSVRLIDTRDHPAVSERPGPRLSLSCPLPSLWPHQVEAVEAWKAAGYRGVWDLPPRSGKTLASCLAVKEAGAPALIVVPMKGLVEQTGAVFAKYFANVVLLHSGTGTKRARHSAAIRSPVWVATPKTAADMDLSSRRTLVIDEFHHAAAATYQTINEAARNAYFRLGMTGTHYRADGADLRMHALAERAVYRRTVGEMVAVGVLAPGRAVLLRTTGEVAAKASASTYRNSLIAWAAQRLAAAGKRVLVLTVEVNHAHELAAAIPGAVAVDGRDNAAVQPALDALVDRRVSCVVGTSVIGEGRDVPAADALVYACGSRSKVKVNQDVFRVLTAYEGKAAGLVVDFADNHDEAGIQRAAERLHYYRSHGWQADVIDPDRFEAWLGAT